MSETPGPESDHFPESTPQVPPSEPLPGRIREQVPGMTVPRPERVGEARARLKAQRDRAAAQARAEADAAAALAKKRRRRKQLIGGGVGVGVVGAIAGIYLIATADDGDSGQTVPVATAYCQPANSDVVVDESYCSRGSYNPALGLILLNGMSYRYHYGGTLNGNRVVGGSYDRPVGTALRTSSGGAVNTANLTSFGADGKSDEAGKAAPPKAGSKVGSGSGEKAGNGKNIKRGGIGAVGGSGGGAKAKGGSGGS
jgi:hypothetical protein